MRIKDIINENWNGKGHGKPGKVRSRVADAMPGAFVQRELRNTDTYMQYRYGIAVAAARANKEHGVPFEQESAWAENLAQVMYTPEDEETIKLASKLMGVTPTRITNNASQEPTSTNAASPVAKPKRNKYGV